MDIINNIKLLFIQAYIFVDIHNFYIFIKYRYFTVLYNILELYWESSIAWVFFRNNRPTRNLEL